VRLFVALDVPEQTRHLLGELIQKFESVCRGARWMRPESIHVTLKFIGDVDETKLPVIKDSLSQVKFKAPVEIAFRHFGFFPNERHPQVFWLGIEAGPELAALASDVGSSLESAGIPADSRAFKPHLTLARFKTEEGIAKLRDAVAPVTHQSFGATTAAEFHLYESVLNSSGAVHTRLATYRFVEGRTP